MRDNVHIKQGYEKNEYMYMDHLELKGFYSQGYIYISSNEITLAFLRVIFSSISFVKFLVSFRNLRASGRKEKEMVFE